MILNKPESKTEYLHGFYINKEIDVLLASTDKSGYIFPISNEIEQILLLSRSFLFQPHFGTFIINKNNEVSGSFALIFTKDNAQQKEIEQLQKLGFIQNEYDDRKLVYSVFLKGKQYTIEGDLPLLRLEKSYTITVKRPSLFSSTPGKIIATPATIAFDTVVVLPPAFLLATFWLIAEN